MRSKYKMKCTPCFVQFSVNKNYRMQCWHAFRAVVYPVSWKEVEKSLVLPQINISFKFYIALWFGLNNSVTSVVEFRRQGTINKIISRKLRLTFISVFNFKPQKSSKSFWPYIEDIGNLSYLFYNPSLILVVFTSLHFRFLTILTPPPL